MLKMSKFLCLVILVLSLPAAIFGFQNHHRDLTTGVQSFEAGDLAAAKDFFMKYTREHAEIADGFYYLGRIYFGENDLKNAEKSFKKALALQENNSLYHTWLGNTYGRKISTASIFKKPGLAKKIKKHFSRAVELDENNHDAREGLIQFYLEAPGIVGGSKEKAKAHAEILKQKYPLLGYRAFAAIYEKEKKYEQAENSFKAAIQAFPENLNLRFQLGYFYQRTEKFAEAFEVFENMLADSADNLAALYQVGRTGAFSGQNLERAEACFKSYLQHEPGPNNPSKAAAHWRLGMVYEHKKQNDLARQEYQAALRLEPDLKPAKQALKKLK